MSECDGSDPAGHHLVDLRQFADARGYLAVAESGQEIGFLTRRVYFMYGAQAGSARGAHAHRKLEQLLIAAQGSFEITLDNGTSRCRHVLDEPASALYVGPMVWREMAHFTSDSICFVLASECYDDSDYIRDYEGFLRMASEAL